MKSTKSGKVNKVKNLILPTQFFFGSIVIEGARTKTSYFFK